MFFVMTYPEEFIFCAPIKFYSVKYCYLAALVSMTVLLFSCQKASENDSDSDLDPNCAKIKNVKIIAEKDSVTVGDEIHLQINEMPDIALYIWTRGGDPTMISNDETLDIYYAEKGDEGWYYLNVSYPD